MNVLVYAKFVDILRLVNPIYILRLTSDACSCVVASVPASSTGKFLPWILESTDAADRA